MGIVWQVLNIATITSVIKIKASIKMANKHNNCTCVKNLSDQSKNQICSIKFAVGVTLTHALIWIISNEVEWFLMIYYSFMIVTMPIRFVTYKKKQSHYYMIDLCYCVNISVILQTIYCKSESYYDSDVCNYWFFTNFILTHGPLLSAIVVWKNGLVYHNIDKMTSLGIHILPVMACYLNRWKPQSDNNSFYQVWFNEDNVLGEIDAYSVLFPVLFYLIWQSSYTIFQITYLDYHPEFMFSQRYLVTHESFMWKIWLKFVVSIGLIDPMNIPPDPVATRTTISFIILQIMFCMLTITNAYAQYNFHAWNAFIVFVTFQFAVFRGATYYNYLTSKTIEK